MGKATLKLNLVMCLSLWTCYIQIKGEFTDRRQAPAPMSNQTLASGGPCGPHTCGHSLTAWHYGVLQESSTEDHGKLCTEEHYFDSTQDSWRLETKTERWAKLVMVYVFSQWDPKENVVCLVRFSRRDLLVWRLFKAPFPSAQNALKSICNRAYFFSTAFHQPHSTGTVCLCAL